MKKLAKSLTMLLVLALLVSCSSSGDNDSEIDDTADDTVSTATIEAETAFDYENSDLSGMVTLGEYKNMEITMESADLTDEEFDATLDELIDSYSYYEAITDRAVAEGDTIVCDYSGYLDGVQFDGGTDNDVTLEASADSGYIDGFAESFIGQMPGIEFSFNVTFPEDYGHEELNGKEVTFVATVKSINGDYITPELTDEFVQENFEGYTNAEEWKIAYRSAVEDEKEYYVLNQMYSDLWSKIVESSVVNTYPEDEVTRIYNQKRSQYESYADYYGTDYDTFLNNYVGMTDNELMEESREYVKEDLVMYTLADELGITVSDEEYNEGLEYYADYYGATTEELENYYGKNTIYATVLWQKMMETVAPMNNIVQ
jgi:trigger factor